MNKLVKIRFRDKTSLTVDIEIAEAILDSKEQLIKIYDSEGVWTGQTINKADILGTDRDFEDERRESAKSEVKRLEGPVLTPERMKELLQKYKPKPKHHAD